MYIENIVIGKPIVEPYELLAKDIEDWNLDKLEKTYFTNDRFLPKILVDIGIYPSVNEIRRNRPDLMISFDSDKLDFIEKLKVGKRRFLWIIVGKEEVM